MRQPSHQKLTGILTHQIPHRPLRPPLKLRQRLLIRITLQLPLNLQFLRELSQLTPLRRRRRPIQLRDDRWEGRASQDIADWRTGEELVLEDLGDAAVTPEPLFVVFVHQFLYELG